MALRILTFIKKVIPLFLVLLCTSNGLYIFRDVPPQAIRGTGVRAANIFRTGVLVLLWRVRLYPTSLKKLGRFMQFIVEFLLATFLVEYLQEDFWLPLEAAIKKLLKKLSKVADDSLELVAIEGGEYTQYISNEWTACFVVYCVSLFLFFSVLYGTKLVDTKETNKSGPEPFLHAITETFRVFLELTGRQKAKNEAQSRKIKGGYNDQDDDNEHRNRIEGGRNDQKRVAKTARL